MHSQAPTARRFSRVPDNFQLPLPGLKVLMNRQLQKKVIILYYVVEMRSPCCFENIFFCLWSLVLRSMTGLKKVTCNKNVF